MSTIKSFVLAALTLGLQAVAAVPSAKAGDVLAGHYGFAPADEPQYIVLASREDLREAKRIANIVAQQFARRHRNKVSVRLSGNGYFAVVLGPGRAAEIARAQDLLKEYGYIPQDSFASRQASGWYVAYRPR